MVNFSSSRPQLTVYIAIVMLISSIGLLVFLLLDYGQLEQDISRYEQKIRKSSQQNQIPRALSKTELQERDLFESIKARLILDWFKLFETLEQSKLKLPEINFVSVLPDTSAGNVIISGESPNLVDVFTLMETLNSFKNVSNALLISHSLIEENKELVIFSLRMEWATDE